MRTRRALVVAVLAVAACRSGENATGGAGGAPPLVAIDAGASAQASEHSEEVAAPAPARRVPAPDAWDSPVKTTAGHVLAAYADNEYFADRKYLEKVLRVDGRIRRVMKDANGNPAVFVSSDGDPGMARFFFGPISALKPEVFEVVASLHSGDPVLLDGFYDGARSGTEIILQYSRFQAIPTDMANKFLAAKKDAGR